MRSLVVEERGKLALRDVPVERAEVLGPRGVRIGLHTAGICGSDVHCYPHGRLGPLVVEAPTIREARVENTCRGAHVFPRCVAMIAPGAIDVKPLITRTLAFEDSVAAFEAAASAPPGDVKMQIELPQ